MDDRVSRQADAAGGAELWRALQPLRSAATWLMFGAHPDDEWNGFLAWLVLGRGMRAVFACATRGEGGQNAIGPERGAALAALRSREMEFAAREIGFGVRWMTPGGDDPVRDFGFSRSGADTLARWGERRLLERMARVIREVRPDAVSPTFLDVPGQHGHHRAVTQSLVPALEMAADPAWVCGLPPWRVSHAYLPAFSGGGGTYDDEVPPPAATVSVDLGERCAALGASWAQIGEWSRRFHATQGMGRWVDDGPRPFALHQFAGAPDGARPLDGRPHDAAALVAGPVSDTLRDAIDAALAAWPDRAATAAALTRVRASLDAAQRVAGPGEASRLLARKQREAARALALAHGRAPRLALLPDTLRAGDDGQLVATGAAGAHVRLRMHPAWQDHGGGRFRIPAGSAPVGTLRDGWDPGGGNDVAGATLTWGEDGSGGQLQLDPAHPVTVRPGRDAPADAGRIVRRLGDPAGVVPGLLELPCPGEAFAAGEAAHVGRFAHVFRPRPAVLGIDLATDRAARVGVVAGETDTTLDWLRQLGIEATALDDDALAAARFAGFSTLLVGAFAFRQRPALRPAALRAWVEEDGGKLVTLYHRPTDAWDAAATPPRRLAIGTPSFRWRVTDPAAPVRVLAPDSPVLNNPNRIGPGDWEGWVRERGLYFASAWDDAYRPLLELADAGHPPLRGALLEGRIGHGSHVHVSLALHHQFPALVPGAFRLLANLVANPG